MSDTSVLIASVVVAIYNIEEYLPRCLDSLARCRSEKVEFLLVNDGSTDSSPEICQEYAQKDGRFVIITQPNKGLSGARNTGMKMAQGAYFLFVDGDDQVFAENLDIFIETLATQAQNSDIVLNDYYRCKDKNKTLIQQVPKDSDQKYFDISSVGKGFWNVWRYAYKKDFISENGLIFCEGRLCEDVDFTTRALMASSKMIFVKQAFYCYEVDRPGSIMQGANPQRTYDLVHIMKTLLVFLAVHPEQQKAHQLEARLFKEFILILPQRVDAKGSDLPVEKEMKVLLDQFCHCKQVQKKAKMVRFLGLPFISRMLYLARTAKRVINR